MKINRVISGTLNLKEIEQAVRLYIVDQLKIQNNPKIVLDFTSTLDLLDSSTYLNGCGFTIEEET